MRRTWSTPILLAVAVVALLVGLLIGRTLTPPQIVRIYERLPTPVATATK